MRGAVYIPPTTAGVRQSLATMAVLARRDSVDVDVVTLAHSLLSAAGGPRYVVQKIRAWLSAQWREVPDPEGVELLRTPASEVRQYLLGSGMSGDCDDIAMVAATLGIALGIRVRYVAVSFGPSLVPSHVYAELQSPAPGVGWFDVDILRPEGPPPEPIATVFYYP